VRGKRPFDLDALLSLRFIQYARLSPDLTRVAYAVSQVDGGRESVVIHVLEIASGRGEQITPDGENCLHPEWSPDGRSLAFLSNREGSRQVFLMHLAGVGSAAGDGARRLTSIPNGVDDGPFWSPDGRHLACTARRSGPRSDASAPYRITRAIYRWDAVGYVEGARQDIYAVSVHGEDASRLTSDEYCIGGLQWSRNSREILFTAGLSPDAPQRSYLPRPRLRVVDLSGAVREVFGSLGEVLSAAWTPKGNRIAFIARMYNRPVGSKNDLWTIEGDGTGLACRSTGSPTGFGDSLQTDMPLTWLSDRRILVDQDGRSALVQGLKEGKAEIYRVALEGPEHCECLVAGERSCFPMDLNADVLLFAASSLVEPMDLSVYSLGSHREKRLTSLNRPLGDGAQSTDVRHFCYRAADGAGVEGWILAPGRRGPPPPAVLFIHGGPHIALGHIFSMDCQHLVGSGYAVVLINQRGSRGYGDEFASTLVGRWGELDYSDLMSGIDHLVDRQWIDPARLGCYGLSAGGYMACWMVGQTDRFRAAVAENPITNFVSFYGVSDIGTSYATQELGGRPHEIPSIYRKCSPITYAHRCTTPTLLIQAEMDYRCPAEQAEQFYTALMTAGCPVEMMRLPMSSHNGSVTGAPSVRRAQNEALLEWMDRYL
jgi:dipeptidyl aminopeptidase/acylaminoacyl peptidase